MLTFPLKQVLLQILLLQKTKLAVPETKSLHFLYRANMSFLTGWLHNMFKLCMRYWFILIFQLLIFVIWVKKRTVWRYLWWLLHDMDTCQQISSFLQPFLTYVRSISRLSSNNLASIIDTVYWPMVLCTIKGVRKGWDNKYSPQEKVSWKCIK